MHLSKDRCTDHTLPLGYMRVQLPATYQPCLTHTLLIPCLQVLQQQIKVYAVGMPPVTLGDEHAAAGTLTLCYMRHAFGLGEHYNSVQPQRAQQEQEPEAAS